MAFCTLCGKPLGWWRSSFGPPDHQECIRQVETRRQIEVRCAELKRLAREEAEKQTTERKKQYVIDHLMEAAESGDFSCINAPSEIILDPGEVCHCVISGVRRAAYFPAADGAGRISFTSEGIIHQDGILPKDSGSLHLTSKRLCFSGTGGVVNLPLRKMLQCAVDGVVLCVGMEGRSTASYFVFDAEIATAVAAAAKTLAVQVKAAPRTARVKKSGD